MKTDEHRLLKLAKLLLPSFIEQHQEALKGRAGICLAVMTPGATKGFQTATCPIGNLPPERFGEEQHLAIEKVTRIQEFGHNTSFQTEDEEKGQYGGGIKVTDELYISASGFPPDLDQAFVVLLCDLCGLLNADRRMRIIEESRDGRIRWQEKRKKQQV